MGTDRPAWISGRTSSYLAAVMLGAPVNRTRMLMRCLLGRVPPNPTLARHRGDPRRSMRTCVRDCARISKHPVQARGGKARPVPGRKGGLRDGDADDSRTPWPWSCSTPRTDDDKFDRAGVRWLGRLMLERPMDLPVAAQAVELVAKLRGPGAEWAAGALGTLAGTSSGRHTVPRLAQRLRGARGTRWVMVLAVPNVLRALSEPTVLRSAQPSRSRPD